MIKHLLHFSGENRIRLCSYLESFPDGGPPPQGLSSQQTDNEGDLGPLRGVCAWLLIKHKAALKQTGRTTGPGASNLALGELTHENPIRFRDGLRHDALLPSPLDPCSGRIILSGSVQVKLYSFTSARYIEWAGPHTAYKPCVLEYWAAQCQTTALLLMMDESKWMMKWLTSVSHL
ncbi:hypothetical protein UPYG_G00038670 [Umbra pygmaea]|uniref:Uncharacterized protein n=1 Tax=Umbra pygmaea TaxID=75934 RepID=A0ABD0XRU6_UMBPY